MVAKLAGFGPPIGETENYKFVGLCMKAVDLCGKPRCRSCKWIEVSLFDRCHET